jgi:transcriptional regulator with XRE-family HTH domain
MGRGSREQPRKLSNKLREIRVQLDYTQDEMTAALNRSLRRILVHRGYVSQFETGRREPSLVVLLAYARLAGVSTDALIDDKIALSGK